MWVLGIAELCFIYAIMIYFTLKFFLDIKDEIGGCQMTQIEMIYSNNIIIGFRMEGHAGFNTEGPDILCASLSTASQMTMNGVLDWTGLSLDEAIKEEDKAKAILHFEIPYSFTSTVTQQLFTSFEMFIEQLMEQYKDNVMLERRQKDDN